MNLGIFGKYAWHTGGVMRKFMLFALVSVALIQSVQSHLIKDVY